MSTELKEKLNLPTLGTEKLLIKTFGSEESELKSCDIVKLCLKRIHDDVSIYLTAYAVDMICSPILNQPLRFATENYEHLQGLKLAENSYDSGSQDINILLGTDQMWNFICGQIIRGQDGLVATLSKFGWLLSGPVNNLPPETFCNPVVTHSLIVDASERTMEVTSEEPSDNHVKQYFKLESLGINSEETSVHDRFAEDIEFDGTRYVVKLPFKDDAPLLPDNYQNS